LTAALDGKLDGRVVEKRRGAIAERHAVQRAARKAQLDSAAALSPLHPAWVSHCIGEAKAPETVVVNEYTLLLEHCAFERAGSYFGSSSASGLGWGAGAALGVKLAEPDRPVIAVLGDGAYLFSNPVAVHHAAAMHELPVLFVIMNNGMWNAVRRSTVAMYPQGDAAASATPPFIHLGDRVALEQVCAAAGGYGERVDDPEALPAALGRAMSAVKEGRQALLNVICQAGD
jgi:acetolactate synthase I/II/III large subunit